MALAPRQQPQLELVTTATQARETASARALQAGMTLCVAACAFLVAVFYQFPAGYQSRHWGLNPLAVMEFAQHWHIAARLLAAQTWAGAFRLGIVLLWGGSVLAIWGAWKGNAPRLRVTLSVAGALAVALACACPPLLTTNPYAYVSYAHLQLFHHLNPYVSLPAPLFAAHDPVAEYLVWNLPDVYGPVWTALTACVVSLLPRDALWGQIVAMKLLAAAALLVLAFAGGRVAERLAPGRGRLTTLALAFNPLLLLEGPASGHNDLLMMAFVLLGAWCVLDGKWGRAGVCLGLAIGIKLLPLLLLPWLLWEIRRSGRLRVPALLRLAGGILVPLIVCYAPYWQGAATFDGLRERAQTAAGAQAFLVIVFLLLSLWMGRTPLRGAFLTAWAALCATLMFTSMGICFPWYIAWFWPVLLLRWDKLAFTLSAACGVLALWWECLYGSLMPLAGFRPL